MESLKRPRLLLLIGVGLLGVAYFAWGLCDSLTELGGDSATYMLMARSLSPRGPLDLALAQPIIGAPYPPLFPAMIGLLGGSFIAAHGLVIACLLLSLLLLYRLLQLQGLAVHTAAAAALLFAMLPGTYLLALNIWSENPYLAFSLLCLLALERARAGTAASAGAAWWTAASAVAACMMIRTAGLPLLLTVSLLTACRRPRQWGWLLGLCWTPLLVWTVLSHLHSSGTSQYAQQLVAQYAHDPLTHLGRQLSVESRALMGAWLSSWLGYAAPWQLIALIGLFGGLAVAGWLMRLRRGSGDAVYAGLYFLMLLLWPWPGEAPRLLYVILPLLIGYGLHFLQNLSTRLQARGSHALNLTAIGLLVLTLLPGLLLTAHRWLAPLPQGLSVLRHIAGYYSDGFEPEQRVARAQAQLIAHMPSLSQRVPAGDCIFQIKPSVLQLLSNRASLTPPLPGTDQSTFGRQIQQCRYAYVMKLQSPTFPLAFYPRDRLGTQYHVLSQLPDDSSPDQEPLAELIELPTARP